MLKDIQKKENKEYANFEFLLLLSLNGNRKERKWAKKAAKCWEERPKSIEQNEKFNEQF